MSRTRHPKIGDANTSLPSQHKRNTKLTKLGPSYYSYPTLVKADGNHWQGTISDVGGDSRRRNQHSRRDSKIIGRRIERRRLKSLINEFE